MDKNHIIVNCKNFVFKHEILVIETDPNQVCVEVTAASTKDIPVTLNALAKKYNLNKIIIHGNSKFTTKLKENTLKYEKEKFNKNELNIILG